MSSLNDLKRRFDKKIQAAAEDLNNSLPLSVPQLRSAFTDQEIKKLHEMIVEIKKATSQNNKAAKLAKYSVTALKLLKKLGVAI